MTSSIRWGNREGDVANINVQVIVTIPFSEGFAITSIIRGK
jgi:hypothetical protein